MPYVRTTGQFTVRGNEEMQQYASQTDSFQRQSQELFYLCYDQVSDRTVLEKKSAG